MCALAASDALSEDEDEVAIVADGPAVFAAVPVAEAEATTLVKSTVDDISSSVFAAAKATCKAPRCSVSKG